ncbi:hypothetical protein COY30_00640 [Candidatus Woesebacteria bacterium CG_4_10_14_0_2_um_filter_44_9]|uniref:DUF2268 domain-containing protein n=1 Tax=Candidatus Woesebacteria bacterium CG_4_10_14_0_2_um_filter_44_9 TaxID=1975055 RepID=A0A2M7TIL7_9BACT|nr:MAG: hypothetical protein COY30_00640 [Candidatus Woesebacteria bacterium CG_4_10_14_0_2_um_filter_44_9]
MSIVHFVYSYPYEDALLKLSGDKLTEKHSKVAVEKTKTAQKIWNKYEKQILDLFMEIYETKILEKRIVAYVSLIAPNSYSQPLTISLKYFADIGDNARSKRAFVYATIHEIAHYFAYTRYPHNFFNKLYKKVLKINLLGSHGKNLHYLIQAVEFGIVGEIFGSSYTEYSRNWVIGNSKGSEYRDSAKSLKKYKVPLDKTCLGFITAFKNTPQFIAEMN